MSETAVKQISQQNLTTKPVKPIEPSPEPVSVPIVAKVKGQKAQQPAGTYQPPTAEYLKAPDGPVVLPVSRFQKVLELVSIDYSIHFIFL